MDLFLIGFFLSIGLSGIPTLEIGLVAFVLALGINIKVLLYFFVLTRFRVRARTAVHTSLTLANYSEFGLIVAAISASSGWLPGAMAHHHCPCAVHQLRCFITP